MKEQIKRGDSSIAVKAGFWYVASTFIMRALAFITTPIFARLMSTQAYGEFSNYASWQSTLLIVTSAELYNTLNRAYYDFKDEYDGYVSSVTLSSCVITLLMYIVFLLCQKWVLRFVAIPPQYIHILFFTLMCASCKQIFLARERTLYRYRSVVVISMLDVLIPTIISVILVVMSADANRLSARIYGFYVPSAIIGLACGAMLVSRGKTLAPRHCSYAFKLALPLLVHYLMVYLLTSTNTIITKNILGAEQTAVVSIATSVIHILTILFQATTGAVTTWMMDNLEQKNYKRIRKGTMGYLGLMVLISTGVILFAPEVVWILGGSKYAAATVLIPGLVVSVLIQNLCSLFTIVLTYDKNVVKTAVYTGVIAVASIVAKVMLLPVLGIQALPVINIAAYLILFVVDYLLVREAGYAKSVNLKGYILAIVAVCIVMLAGFVLYENRIIRYAAIAVIGVVGLALVYKNRDSLRAMIHKRRKNKKAAQ